MKNTSLKYVFKSLFVNTILLTNIIVELQSFNTYT